LLSSRGTFFRLILLPEDPTPQAVISDELWQMHRENNVVYIGKPGTPKDVRVEP